MKILRDFFTRDRLAILCVLMAFGLGGWAFIELADEIEDDEKIALDESLLLMLRNPDDTSDPIGPPWFEEMARDVTALGGNFILTGLVLLVSVFLILTNKRTTVVILVLSSATGALLSHSLKAFFDRARPDLVPHQMQTLTASFPSGHSLLSAVIYLTIGVLLARSQSKRSVKTFILLSSALLTILVGISRVYLGVHWPTDVLGGWTIGSLWALTWWIIAYFLLRNREVDPDTQRPD